MSSKKLISFPVRWLEIGGWILSKQLGKNSTYNRGLRAYSKPGKVTDYQMNLAG